MRKNRAKYGIDAPNIIRNLFLFSLSLLLLSLFSFQIQSGLWFWIIFLYIEDKKGREQALLEMLRILKPGGKFAIADIQRAKEYGEFLLAEGVNAKYSKPNYSYCPPITIIEEKKP